MGYGYGFQPRAAARWPFLGKSGQNFDSHEDMESIDMPMLDMSLTDMLEEKSNDSMVCRPEPVSLPSSTEDDESDDGSEDQEEGQKAVEVLSPGLMANPVVVGKKNEFLPPILIDKWPKFKAGRISQCIDEWAKITSDPKVLADIRGYKIEFDQIPVQKTPVHPIRFSKEEHGFMKCKVAEYLEAGIIQKAKHVQGEVISNIFLVPKKETGKFRMILNLKKLNLDVE